MKLYRGLSAARGEAISAGKEKIAATSNGEFGSGSYYWANDLPAAIISAVKYYGQQPGGWAVLEVIVDDARLKSMTKGRLLNFRSGGNSANYDPSTQTTTRDVSIREQDKVERMDFRQFREINADPEKFNITGVTKNTMPWPDHPVIAGPTVAAPKDVLLTQIKFAHEGLDIVNAGTKTVVVTGTQMNNQTFKVVNNWTLDDRKKIFSDYFQGKTHVTLNF